MHTEDAIKNLKTRKLKEDVIVKFHEVLIIFVEEKNVLDISEVLCLPEKEWSRDDKDRQEGDECDSYYSQQLSWLAKVNDADSELSVIIDETNTNRSWRILQ